MIRLKLESINWEKVDQLVPVIVQQADTSQVLMLGYMNKQALDITLSTRQVTFYSRTKRRLWTKGETSGHYLKLRELFTDCDADTLLALVEPQGPTCHKGTQTCFGESIMSDWSVVKTLEMTIDKRLRDKPKGSYVANLQSQGQARVAQKVGEEAVEVVIAALVQNREALTNELADLFFHILVLMKMQGISMTQLLLVLKRRLA